MIARCVGMVLGLVVLAAGGCKRHGAVAGKPVSAKDTTFALPDGRVVNKGKLVEMPDLTVAAGMAGYLEGAGGFEI